MPHRGPPTLARYVAHLVKIFKLAPDKHEAHRRCAPVLQDMTSDRPFVTQALAAYLKRPGILNAQNYPVVGVEVALNEWFSLVVHGWIPRPDHSPTISSKAIHHHGELLLTTATMSGPGYEHWLFTRPKVLDPEKRLYEMNVTDKKWHPTHDVAFVDAHIPHMPWYPPDTTLTLCLWSDQRPTTWRDRVKRIPLLKKNEYRLRAVAAKLGVTDLFVKAIGLKLLEALDFYPDDDGFHAIPERQEFDKGPNEDHLQSVFCILQHTGNQALGALVEERLRAEPDLKNRATIERLLADLRADRPIEGRLSDCHLALPNAMFPQADVERALAAQARRG
jgi:hypothetical protein